MPFLPSVRNSALPQASIWHAIRNFNLIYILKPEHMALLAEFPPEILSVICSSLNGFDIAHLWSCGDSMLLARLKVAVTQFSLSLAQTIDFSWPKLISQFTRLESLSILPRSENHSIWFRDVDFYGISSSLKHLELEFDNLEFSLFGLPFVVFDPHPDPIRSPPTEGEMVFSPFALSTHFPRLETLRLGGEMKFPKLLIPLLPSGLLSLSLPYECIDPSLLRQLPSNLTWLSLSQLSEVDFDETGLQFPSNLTYLDIASFNLLWDPTSVVLPPTLTHLEASFEVMRENDSAIPVPPSLVTWCMYGWSEVSDEFAMHLPAGLIHLQAESHKFPLEPKDFPLRLQTLSVGGISGLSDESIIGLPRTLTKVKLSQSTLTKSCFLSFPPFLRSLTIQIPLVGSSTPYAFMHTLEELTVPKLDPSVLEYAPNLRFLNIWDYWPLAIPLNFQNLHSLTKLTISSHVSPLESVIIESFPKSLIQLSLPILSPHLFQQLPSGLKRLRIEQGGIENASIAHLPHGLIELLVRKQNTNGDSISDASIELLPRSLEYLQLFDTYELTDIGIANLPRHLIHCNLGRVPLLTNSSASLFPRQLKILELRGTIMYSNECVKHLPRTLRTLTLHKTPFLTKECYPDLPPRISQLLTRVANEWTAKVVKGEEILRSLHQ